MPKNKKQKENKKMREKMRKVHENYCDYEVEKAKSPSRILSVRQCDKRKRSGIRTSGLSKAMLAHQMAALF